MAERLINAYGHSVAKRIATGVYSVWPSFDRNRFLRSARAGYDALNLMQRGQHLARVLHTQMAMPYREAMPILLRSFAHIPPEEKQTSMASFVYLPFSFFIAEFGLDDFDLSMQAQHQLTQRFTAEFCIRPFLLQHTAATLQQLQAWLRDDSEHVRRLVSEGTRPRLPWAMRLPPFQRDPTPVLALLEQLKDDPSDYVRRSVANNLNDIGKDHPDQLLQIAERWQQGATPARQQLLKHALRSLIKHGAPRALAVMNVDHRAKFVVTPHKLTPKRVALGNAITLSASVHNPTKRAQKALIDYRIHFVKANGSLGAKVFKLKTVDIASGDTITISKSHRLVMMTTRTLYRGEHIVELLVNGQTHALGQFYLQV